MIPITILFKIGGFPFHQWLINLRISLSWERLLVVLTIQKALPLLFLSHCGTAYLVFVSVTGWLIIRITRALTKQLKKLFLLSSIFFLRAISLAPILGGGRWKSLLVLYSFIFCWLASYNGGEQGNLRNSPLTASSSLKVAWIWLMLVVRGVPPFPGFLLKLEIVCLVFRRGGVLAVLRFLIGRILFIYVYFSLLLWLVTRGLSLKRDVQNFNLERWGSSLSLTRLCWLI